MVTAQPAVARVDDRLDEQFFDLIITVEGLVEAELREMTRAPSTGSRLFDPRGTGRSLGGGDRRETRRSSHRTHPLFSLTPSERSPPGRRCRTTAAHGRS